MVKNKSKRKKVNTPASKRYKFYKVDGDFITRERQFCPRCGPGIFLMKAKDRIYCGKCKYTEFMSKSEEKK